MELRVDVGWSSVSRPNNSLKNDDESGVPDSDPRLEAGIEFDEGLGRLQIIPPTGRVWILVKSEPR